MVGSFDVGVEEVVAVLGPEPLTLVVIVSDVKEVLPLYLITSNLGGNFLRGTIPSNIFKLKRYWESDAGRPAVRGSVQLVYAFKDKHICIAVTFYFVTFLFLSIVLKASSGNFI